MANISSSLGPSSVYGGRSADKKHELVSGGEMPSYLEEEERSVFHRRAKGMERQNHTARPKGRNSRKTFRI